MLGVGAGFGASFRGPISVTEAVDDWVQRAVANGGIVSAGTKAAVLAFFGTVNGLGLLPKIRRLNLFAGENLAACLTPQIAGGSSVDINANFVEADYDTALGLRNGSGRWLNTGLAFPAGTMLGGFTINARASLTATAIHFFGATQGTSHARFNKTGVGSVQESVWGGTASGTVVDASLSFAGVWRATRKSATLNRISRDGTVETAVGENLLNLPTIPAFIFARNLNGVASGIAGSAIRWSGYAIDDGTIPDASETAWRGAFSTCRIALGRP